MQTLDEVKAQTLKIFEHEGLTLETPKVPEPSPIWREKIDALAEANLMAQRSSAIFDMRCEQAAKMGFVRLESSQMVKMLMGDPHTETFEGKDRQNHEWIYCHHTDTAETKTTWGGTPTIFIRKTRTNAWFLPPFSKKEIWRVQFGKLDYLKREIPYGVVLRINELKKLKLFNAFSVLAPMEAWERKTDIDPIVVASIWEYPLSKRVNPKLLGRPRTSS